MKTNIQTGKYPEELKRRQSPPTRFRINKDVLAKALLEDTIILFNLEIKTETLKPDLNGHYSGFLDRTSTD